MEKLFKTLTAVLFALLVSVSFTACGDDDDDEPGYDATKPYIGTWIVEDVRNWNYKNFYGGLLLDEDQARQDFINEWTGKKIKITSKTKVEDGKIYIEESSLERIFIELNSSSESKLNVHFTRESINSSNKDIMSRTTATMELKRK